MAESIRSGFIVAARCLDKETSKYGVCCQCFARGVELPSSKAFVVDLEVGVMHLSHPSRSKRDIPRRILACAQAARNSLLEELPNGSIYAV